MDEKKRLNEIKKYIKIKAIEQEKLYSSEKYKMVKKILEKKESKKEEEFTFTIGEVNAYLG